MLPGGKTYERDMAMDEFPVYVKAGAVIPYHTDAVKNLKSNALPISINVYPGGDGAFRVYEDAGDDDNYPTEFAYTDIAASRNGQKLKVEIKPERETTRRCPEIEGIR